MRGAELLERHLIGVDLSGRDATGIRILESRIDDVDLSDANLRRGTFRDTLIERGTWANADATEMTLTRMELRGVGVLAQGLGVRVVDE